MEHVIMLVICLAVIGGMGALLTWFFKRLQKIEEARWGGPRKQVDHLGREFETSRWMPWMKKRKKKPKERKIEKA